MELNKLIRGTICVLREYPVDGQLKQIELAIVPQKNYLEWVGCFSII